MLEQEYEGRDDQTEASLLSFVQFIFEAISRLASISLGLLHFGSDGKNCFPSRVVGLPVSASGYNVRGRGGIRNAQLKLVEDGPQPALPPARARGP